MKIELDSLIQKFQSCRAKAKGKKAVYPTRLRKAAALLALEHSPKKLSTDLGVSAASIRVWSKSFAPNVIESDLVSVELAKDAERMPKIDEDIKVKIVAMEVSVPSAKFAGTLADIVQGMGGSSC